MSATPIIKRLFPAVGSTTRLYWDWRRWLAAKNTAIDSFVVTVPDGVTLGATSEGIDDQAGVVYAYVTVPMDEDMKYTISCTVTTQGGEITTRSLLLSPLPL